MGVEVHLRPSVAPCGRQHGFEWHPCVCLGEGVEGIYPRGRESLTAALEYALSPNCHLLALMTLELLALQNLVLPTLRGRSNCHLRLPHRQAVISQGRLACGELWPMQ